MSYPILYSSTATTYTNNGLGVLSDALSCVVTEERNGAYELEMRYPVDGIHFSDIFQRSIILAKPNPVDDPQPFRVYRITSPLSGIVTVYAEHISYDLSGIPVSPFTATSAASAMDALEANAAVTCPFTFWTDKTTSGTMTVTAPASARALLGGVQGSVLDVYGGEYKFDHWTVRLYAQRGQNRGVSIRYGKNLINIEQEQNCASVYTGTYPYWIGSDGTLVQLPEKTINASGNYDFTRILSLDLSQEWQTAPSAAQLRSRASNYMAANAIGTPKVSLSVSFVQLEQTEEYKDLALLERVELCDTVNVEFPALGVSATAKVVCTVYDCLMDRYDRVDLGDARGSIAKTIVSQAQQIAAIPSQTKSVVQTAVDEATALITGESGGYVVLRTDAAGKPYEILIMDTPDIETAVKVWRWNKAGLGYSKSGYNGPYGTAITQNGAIVADYITSGTMQANRIKGGTLSLGGASNGNGVLKIYNASGALVGQWDASGINAIAGTVGNWVLGATTISQSHTAADGKAYTVVLANYANDGDTSRVFHCSVDGVDTFQILRNGKVYAKNADITGKVTATSGSFTGKVTATSGSFDSVTIGNSTITGSSISGSAGTVSGGTYSSPKINGGTLGSSTGGTYVGTISGGTLTGSTGGTYVGKCSGSKISSCSLDGTALELGKGTGEFSNNGSGQALVYGASSVLLKAGSSSVSFGTSGQMTLKSISLTGNLNVSGTKNRVIGTGHFGQRCLSAFETPLATFADYGTGKVDESGSCYICLDPTFAETVNSSRSPTVFLTKYGQGDIWVEAVAHDCICVRGTPGLHFAWETRYMQANTAEERLPVIDYGDPLAGTTDFDADAKTDLRHATVDYDEEAAEYLDSYDRETTDYGEAGAEYYERFERSVSR